jgi:menaquinone-dependent protoporphyrinogen IX oxidase
MQVMRWCGDAEKFIKKFQDELRKKKSAIFVSSGTQVLLKHDGKTDAMENDWKKNLEEKAEKYSLAPVALGLFGGIWDYNKMGFIAKKTMGSLKGTLEEIGIQEQDPGVYDTRDWDKIRKWTRKLAQKVRGNET